MIIINYGEDKALELKVKFTTANTFAKKFCQGKSIVETLPEKLGEFDGEFLIEMVNHFQVGSKKLTKDEIGKILDEVFEKEDYDLPTLYSEFLKEFDYAGVFKKGMGFSLANQMEKQFAMMVDEEKMDKIMQDKMEQM